MKNKNIAIFSLLILTSTIISCNKQVKDPNPMVENQNRGYIQVFNATVNSNRNFVFVNGERINGSTIAYGSVFPSAYGFTAFAGDNTISIKDTLATSAQIAQSFVQNIKVGSSYTIFTYDTIKSPKRLIVENSNIETPTDSTARLRFVNLIYNSSSTPAPNVDIYSVTMGTNLFTNIPIAQITNYIPIPSTTTDTWQIRTTGTTTVLASASITSTTITPGKSYTAVYRGSQITPTTAPKALTVIANN